MPSTTFTKSTDRFELGSEVKSTGREVDVIEGFLATTVVDKENDMFTKTALKDMAGQINNSTDATVDTVFPGADIVDEEQVGNTNHENNPAMPGGDTRIVPSFKLVEADVRPLPGQEGEFGLHVKGELNSDGLPGDVVSAIKNSIREGFLHSFSIEFKPKQVAKEMVGGTMVRVIEKAKQAGAALTGRPANPTAGLTDALLKSSGVDFKVEYAYSEGDEVSWDSSGGTTSGTVQGRTKDSCFNERIDGDFEVCGTEDDPAYLIEVDNDEGSMVAHLQSTLSSADNKTVDVKQLPEEERVPPEAAQENAQQALDAKEDTGNPNGCGTEAGWTRAEQLTEGDALSMDTISRMAQFKRHQDNSEMSDEEGRADCGWMMWKAWGGDEGVEWANRQMEKAEDMKTLVDQLKVTVQTPDYEATSGSGRWERPAREDFPEDYDANSIFIVPPESGDFSDGSLPVVDFRDGEPTLVLGGLESAHTVASRVEGLSEEEVGRVRDKIEELAEEEFDEDLSMGMDDDAMHGDDEDAKTNVKGDKMPEEQEEPEVDPEDEVKEEDAEEDVESGESEGEAEGKTVKEEVSEIKEQVQEVTERNEELKEENEELKQELEDLKTLKSVEEGLDEIKEHLEDVGLEDGPRVNQDQNRAHEQKTEKAEWKSTLDSIKDPESYLGTEGKSGKTMLKAFAENHGVDAEEVKSYVSN